MKPLLIRNKTIKVVELEQNRFLLHSYLSDEVHEMDVKLVLDTEYGTILSVEAAMPRCPYPDLCPAALKQMPKLTGLSFTNSVGRKVRDLLDGKEGCEHLKELVLDALKGYVPAIGFQTIRRLTEKYRAQGLAEDEVNRQVMADLERIGQNVVPGKCIVYHKKDG
jgi:hypothetical protein